jgi:nitrate/TMAO reductase-like tetraheme cytochrome c subunit
MGLTSCPETLVTYYQSNNIPEAHRLTFLMLSATDIILENLEYFNQIMASTSSGIFCATCHGKLQDA